jgi:hypothetical protein
LKQAGGGKLVIPWGRAWKQDRFTPRDKIWCTMHLPCCHSCCLGWLSRVSALFANHLVSCAATFDVLIARSYHDTGSHRDIHIYMFAYRRFDSVFAFTALFYHLLLPYQTYELPF